MQKLQRDWEEISAELSRHLSACKLGYREFSSLSGLSYHTARRYLLSCQAKNRNSSAESLCKYFGIPLQRSANVQTEQLEKIKGVIRDVWDGTVPHAELIVELIKATKSFKIDGRE